MSCCDPEEIKNQNERLKKLLLRRKAVKEKRNG